MTTSRRLHLTVAFMLVATLAGFAGDVKIIANPSVKATTISGAELRSVFLLQRRTLSDGSSVEPVLQKGGVTDSFMKRYLNRDGEEIWIYYQGLVFTGKGSMPKQLGSDADVVAYVARTRGAIGYVSTATPVEGVRVLQVASGEPIRDRALLSRIEPEYPETLKRMGIGGTVRLQMLISPKGTVENVLVLGGNPILGEAAAKAVRHWIYAAAPNPSTIEVTIPFAP